MRPHIITRFLLRLPKPGHAIAAEQMARAKVAAKLVGMEKVPDLPFDLWVKYAPSSPESAAAKAWLDIAPGKAAAPRSYEVADGDVSALADKAEAEAQVFNLLDWQDTELTLLSDMAGVRPAHIAEDESGHWVATRILDLLAVEPDWAQPLDRIGLQSLLMFRGVYNDRTLHQPVRRLQSGTVLRWRAQTGVEMNRSRRATFPQQDIDVDLERFCDDVGEALQSAYIQLTKAHQRTIPLALSGGYDSRVLAAAGVKAGISQAAYSYGRWYHDDPFYAAQVAKALKIPFQRVPFSRDETLENLDRFVTLSEGCGDPMASQYGLVNHPGMTLGTPLVTGYSGNTTSGTLYSRLPVDSYDSYESIAAGFVASKGAVNLDARPTFGFAFDTQALQHDIYSNLNKDLSITHASNLCWKENNDRRFVVGVYLTLGEKFDLLWPMHDRNYFNIWGRLPRAAIEHHVGLEYWMRRDFPAVAAIPHAKGGLLTPKISAELKRFAYDMGFRALKKLNGRGRAWLEERGLGSDTYHWHNLLLAHHQVEMEARIDAARHALANVLGLELSQDYWMRLEGKPQARRLLLSTAAWAQRVNAHLRAVEAALQGDVRHKGF